MSLESHILDNQAATVREHLRRNLHGAHAFDLASAYFTIYGYELLAEELDQVGSVRFLFGEPKSVEDLDPGEDKPKSFELTERGLEPNHTLEQKALAKQCAEWVRRDTVAVRSVSRANFLHGKMYLTTCPNSASGVVGSSNFTRRGLGGSEQPNLEINLATDDADTLAELQDWFDRLWSNDQLTEDVKQEVLDSLARIGGDFAPEVVYYKTLYELFRKDIAARLVGDDTAAATGFTDSRIWNALYEFQKDGAKSAIAKLMAHNGCILADSVGLGKTYTALAVIKYFELHNQHVLVLCPRKLFENWTLYPAIHGHRQNPFREDRFGFTVLAHTDLSRTSGPSGGVNLANFHWENYDLVVIDESHNFRNDGGQRYQRLLEQVIKAGAKTKVLMLSATPVNTSLIDLRNQVYLMTEGREDAFQQSLGVGNIRTMMAAAQRQFKAWESEQAKRNRRDKAKLLENLGADFLRLLGGVSISRSRRQIERFYADEMERVGQFPKHEQPDNRYPQTDIQGELSYQDLAQRIGKFKLSLYQPSEYVTDEGRLLELAETRRRQNFNQQDSERFLIGMMRTNFLKRLESSAHSLTLTLDRTVSKIDDLMDKIERYQNGGQLNVGLENADVLPDEDDEDEEFFVGGSRRPYRLTELDLPRWQSDLQNDKATLEAVRERVAAITPDRDGKLQEIKHTIRSRKQTPTADRDGNDNRKLLVFTTFKDTAQYLYDNLTGLADELGLNIAMVSGDETHATVGANDFNAILTNFAPAARNRGEAGDAPDIDLLIATDCISEGQNLQDCDTVLNYDIHWNPVRLIQRFGRIDRIGSRSQSVRMLNYWPTSDMDVYLKLESRVQARMALADIAASGDEDPFTEADAQLELNFRDEQLLKLMDEVLTIDDLDDGPVMSDFTLDHFLTQLLRYLEANKDELEAMPHGVYAVAPSEAEAQPGVIFFLRQRNADDAGPRQRPASPVHPFFLCYIQDDGSIRFGCGNARQTLAVFEAAAVGETAPITELCDRFDQDTRQGRDMSLYDKLLNAVIAHIRQTHNSAQIKGLRFGGRGFMLSADSEAPRGAADFELLTWLIIKDRP
ncbi:MAG: phospholipase D-like domain-containing protein [Chloroflexota bacterium]|nr:phospholipase D-like domain-containing protein [Chloroflexota bacterium]MDE2684058.1 phospholipase D-like domain-containing protein [Chloroflexota bacterium]